MHLMIDLETMGTEVNAPIISIGAVFFDPDIGELGDTFDEAIDLEDAFRWGKCSGSTVKWWMGQGDEARKRAIRGTQSSQEAFGKFLRFCARESARSLQPWGNGASFDISMLDYAIPRITGQKMPWMFWNVRDCRTIKEIANGVVADYTNPREGVYHSALDDAIYQAKWVSHFWQHLRVGVCAAPEPVRMGITTVEGFKAPALLDL
jgi:hypothetical protein